MRRRWTSVAWAVLLVAISGAAGAWIGGHLLAPTRETHQAFHEELFRKVNLTAGQHAQMEELERRHAIEQKAAEERVRTANLMLVKVLKEEDSYTANTDAAIDHVHEALLDLQKTTIRHLYEMRGILDANQRKIFDRHVEAAFQQFAE